MVADTPSGGGKAAGPAPAGKGNKVVYHEPDGDILAILDETDPAYERKLDRLRVDWYTTRADVPDKHPALTDIHAAVLRDGKVGMK